MANSVVIVLPMMIAPACFRNSTGAESYSGTKSEYNSEPAVLGTPATLNMSLTPTGIPFKQLDTGFGTIDDFFEASSKAVSGSILAQIRSLLSSNSDLRKHDSISSAGDSSPSRINSEASAIVSSNGCFKSLCLL